MINFYPGPSKLYPQIVRYLQEAFELGILEMNHRSEDFMELYAATRELIKEKLSIPSDYEIVFVSSATECWEIISQSFVRLNSFHCYNGAFGEKWFHYARKIRSNSSGQPFSVEELPDLGAIPVDSELLAFTHNETANGTALPVYFQESVRQQFPASLIAYDATSSMAGYALNWSLGDIWYASVQKCFGLPPGLAIMVVGPEAIRRAEAIGDDTFYNSFNYVLSNARKNQTHHTPNISNIFLLNRTLQNCPPIQFMHSELMERKSYFYEKIASFNMLSSYVISSNLQSDTVFCIKADTKVINHLKSEAKKRGIILGNGYGELKASSFRVANFPAILQSELEHFFIFLSDFFRVH